MDKTTWKTQIRIPSIEVLTDECPWVTVKQSEYTDKMTARAFFLGMQTFFSGAPNAAAEWGMRFVESVTSESCVANTVLEEG